MKQSAERTVRDNRFPPSLFFAFFGVLLLMSGIHTGLVVGMNELGWSDLTQVFIPLVYWSAVAVGLTLFTRRQVQKVYEEPMHRLAEATQKEAIFRSIFQRSTPPTGWTIWIKCSLISTKW